MHPLSNLSDTMVQIPSFNGQTSAQSRDMWHRNKNESVHECFCFIENKRIQLCKAIIFIISAVIYC